MLQSFPCKVVGVNAGERAQYIDDYIQEGDELQLVLEPKNPTDPLAVAVYHQGTKIGYIAAERRWVRHSLLHGDVHLVTADDVLVDDADEIVGIAITVSIVTDEEDLAFAPALEAEPETQLAGTDYLPNLPPEPMAQDEPALPHINVNEVLTATAPEPPPQSSPVREDRQWTFAAPLAAGIGVACLALAGAGAWWLRQTSPNAVAPVVMNELLATATAQVRANYSSGVCPAVTAVLRNQDGSISAECGNGERFRLYHLKGKDYVMRCQNAKALGVDGC